MRKLTEQDLAAIIGTTVQGYEIIKARVKSTKQSRYSDTDHYGIALGRNACGYFVTWQFHLIDEVPSFYWGHYYHENHTNAILDFDSRE